MLARICVRYLPGTPFMLVFACCEQKFTSWSHVSVWVNASIQSG